jgi:deazaflavin-dependent oxidoreductase (nitroreductase family)
MRKVPGRGDDARMMKQSQDSKVQHQPRWYQRIIKRAAGSRVGAWLLSHTLHRMDLAAVRLSKGRRTVANTATGLPIVTLTMRGARTGKLHTTPLIGLLDGDNLVVIASNWDRPYHAGWYYNLRANPEVTLSMKGHSGTYVAHEAAGEEREEYWRGAVDLYNGYKSYQQRTRGRKIPVIVLRPKRG